MTCMTAETNEAATNRHSQPLTPLRALANRRQWGREQDLRGEAEPREGTDAY